MGQCSPLFWHKPAHLLQQTTNQKTIATSAFSIFLLTLLLAIAANAQLSPGSGINPADTYAVFDLTAHDEADITFSQPVYDPQIAANTTSMHVQPTDKQYHIEVGYDSNDQLVMNIFPSAGDTASDDVSKIQLTSNKVILFDSSGNPLPMVLPLDGPVPEIGTFIPGIPGASILQAVFISDPNTFAAQKNGTVQYGSRTNTTSAANGSTTTTTTQMAYVTVANQANPGGNTTLAYQQNGTAWQLSSASISPSTSSSQGVHTLIVAGLQWNSSSDGDNRRSSKVAAIPPLPTGTSPSFSIPLLGCTNETTLRNDLGTGPNVVFQHGLRGHPSSWNRMYPWITGDFHLGTVVRPQLNACARLGDQATALVSLIGASGKTNFIMIGHSQGGLISRDFQHRRPDLTQGVITVDTPHQGAYIDLTLRVALAGFLNGKIDDLLQKAGCTNFNTNAFCFIGQLFGPIGAAEAVNWAADTAIPATQDLFPGSPYLQNLNGQNETFTRVGVASYAAKRWSLIRVGGDAICNPESLCGGRSLYIYANVAYYILRVLEIIYEFLGDPDKAAFYGFIANWMDIVDFAWNRLTIPPGAAGTDGIVDADSQAYHQPTQNYFIARADSHVGAPKSDKVRSVLDQALVNQFFVVGSNCAFSIAPTAASIQDVGGSATFNVTTSSGCAWSAVSLDPWITVTSGFSGTSSGTVAYTVDINLLSTTRVGHIQAGSRQITITQSGLPAGVGIGYVTVAGAEQSAMEPGECGPTRSPGGGGVSPCPPLHVYDSGTVSVTINGHTNSGRFGIGSTPVTVASALAANINADAASPVRAGVMGNRVFVVSKVTSGGNYPYSAASDWNSDFFSQPSFTATTTGSSLVGSQ